MSTSQFARERPEVSVVIPCYNQGHFLGEAIESVLHQTFSGYEITVIDDGSTDNTRGVASLYKCVQYVHQRNRGRSAARNIGLAVSSGRYVVFLDADDRLLPAALETGIKCFGRNVNYAFVSGVAAYINEDGSLIRRGPATKVDGDHYAAVLRDHYIYALHTVMFRRSILEEVGGFDPLLPASEDYDLYLRITKSFPVFHHGELIAEYRQHGENTSHNAPLLLMSGLAVHRSQREHTAHMKEHRIAYRRGVRRIKRTYGTGALLHHLKGEVRPVVRGAANMTPGFFTVLRHVPEYLPKAVLKAVVPASVWDWVRPRWQSLRRREMGAQ